MDCECMVLAGTVHSRELTLTQCVGLNKNGLHRVMCLNVWSSGNGTISRYSLVGVSLALLEEVYHWRLEF